MSKSNPRVKPTVAKTKYPTNVGRPISLLGPLDHISEDQMKQLVNSIYIISCHGCRTGTSFEVNNRIFVVSTSRHQYKAVSPIFVKVGPSYSVIEPTKVIAQNVANANTIGVVVESIRNSIVPEFGPATKNHALSKRTRAVVKMRDSDSKLMTIPDSRLFIAGKEISGYEGVFVVNKQERRIDDVTTQFGLTERNPAERTIAVVPRPHPQHDYLTHIIEHLKQEVIAGNSILTKPESMTEAEVKQLKRYIEIKKMDIRMLKIELKNESVQGKYKYVAPHGTHLERDVHFSDIANHPRIQDGDVIILHVCNGICDERMSFMHGERDARPRGLTRTPSSILEKNVLKGAICDPDVPDSDAGDDMGGGNSNLKTKKNNNIKRKKYKRLRLASLASVTVKRRALHRKLRRSRIRSYRKSYHIFDEYKFCL